MSFLIDMEKQLLLDRYFDIEWCDDVTDLRCVRCHRVAIKHCMSSCQHIFCKTCSRLYNNEEQPLTCPQCKETITQPKDQDLNVEIEIHQLKMFCPNKKFGCTYAGQLGKLPTHLMACTATRNDAFPLESPEIMADDVIRSTNLNATVASTSEDNNIKGNGADMQVASENYTGESESMKLQLESMNQIIQQTMDEMKTKMTSMTQEIETLKKELKSCQKQSEDFTPLKPGTYDWTIKNVTKNIQREIESETFNLPGYKYDIKARFERFCGSSLVSLQFKYGRKINEFFNDGGFGAVKYIARDQTNMGQRKDILCENYLKFNDGSGDKAVLFENFLPDEVFAPPYLVDDCLKITIILEPRSIDRSFVSNNGILEWRVDHYRKRLEERLYSPIFSPSFYTSPTGYRVRIELEISNSQSMVVTPHFLTGEHDGRLPLNFPRQTTLTLINQTDPSRNLVISERCPELDRDTMELSTTAPMEESGFIKDDSFVLKVVIEPVATE